MVAFSEYYDPLNLAETGWGVIYSAKGDPALASAIRQAISPLIKWRTRQAYSLMREFEAYPGETAAQFLARNGVGSGTIDPQRVPYYLLIVAPPTEIYYSFQADLSQDFAVGRLWFDQPTDFAGYAQSLIEAEKTNATLPRAAFFAPAIPSGPGRQGGAQALIASLALESPDWLGDWPVETAIGQDATKARLSQLVGQAPRLLVAAGKGLSYSTDRTEQRALQGGLLCQDWPGPDAWKGPIPPDFYFQAADVPAASNLSGMIALLISDYSAGTPLVSEANRMFSEAPPRLANQPFVASLPQRLLSQPAGAALAVVGMLDSVWSWSIPNLSQSSESFQWIFRDGLDQLASGTPLGAALAYIHRHEKELAAGIAHLQEEAQFGKQVDSQALVATWAQMNDFRNLAILGDPAVRLGGSSA